MHLRAALTGILAAEPHSAADLLEVVRAARRLGLPDLERDAGRAALDVASRQIDKAPVLAATAMIEVAEIGINRGVEIDRDPALLLAEADSLLRLGANTEGWAGRLAELQAQLAGSPEQRRALQEAAAKAFDAAGDVRRAQGVGASVKATKSTVVLDIKLT